MKINVAGNDWQVRWCYADFAKKRKVVCLIEDKTGACIDSNSQCNKEDSTLMTTPEIKEKGKRLSLTRAIALFPKEERTKIWEQYRTITKTERWAKPIPRRREHA